MQHNGWDHGLKVTDEGADPGAALSGPTVRRALGLGGNRTLARIAQARARIRTHVWKLIEDTHSGFPRLVIAGKTLRIGVMPSEVSGCPGYDGRGTV